MFCHLYIYIVFIILTFIIIVFVIFLNIIFQFILFRVFMAVVNFFVCVKVDLQIMNREEKA